jgi:hypothetical protein
MRSVAAEAMAAVVVEDSTVVVEVAVHSVAAEASGAVDSAAVMAEASGEDMAATVTADGDAATGAAGALDGDGVGPVTRMDTLTMDILTLTDIRVTTATIPTLIADSKHTDPLLLTKRHLALTAVR